VTGVTVSGNTAVNLGAGVYVEFASVAVTSSNISGNAIPNGVGNCQTCAGAGLYCTGKKTFTISTSQVTGNTVGGNGQGVLCF
jgi:hypothetical protein